MNENIAVDIVLLPSLRDMQRIISLIEYDEDSVIKLNTKDCLPHITLAMGVLNLKNLDEAIAIVDKLALTAGKIDFGFLSNSFISPDGKNLQYLEIAENEDLSKLQIEVIDSFKGLLSNDIVETNMFYSPPQVAKVTTHWVKEFFKENPHNFKPHFTLGEGELTDILSPIEMSATQIALCHLGSYCTCRKILN